MFRKVSVLELDQHRIGLRTFRCLRYEDEIQSEIWKRVETWLEKENLNSDFAGR